MAMSLNRAQIIGNLTRDPEVRQIPSGATVTTFGVATNFTWTDSNGQRQEKTEFHNIVAWGKLGEICGQYLRKGMKVYIEGRIQTRDWEGEDGVKRYKTEIVAENMIMLDRKGNVVSNNGGYVQNDDVVGNGNDAQNVNVGAEADGSNNDGDISIDDLPF